MINREERYFWKKVSNPFHKKLIAALKRSPGIVCFPFILVALFSEDDNSAASSTSIVFLSTCIRYCSLVFHVTYEV